MDAKRRTYALHSMIARSPPAGTEATTIAVLRSSVQHLYLAYRASVFQRGDHSLAVCDVTGQLVRFSIMVPAGDNPWHATLAEADIDLTPPQDFVALARGFLLGYQIDPTEHDPYALALNTKLMTAWTQHFQSRAKFRVVAITATAADRKRTSVYDNHPALYP